MFWDKKTKEDSDKKKEKLLRKVLGKDSGRKVFGFQCSPDIHATLRAQADKLHVPLFALAEHVLQLGSMQMVEIMNNPAELELLRRHLVESHVDMRTIEKIERYDKEAAEILTVERIRRFDIEKAARKLVIKFMSWGHKPEELEELIIFGSRCHWATAHGWPMPPQVPSRSNVSRPPETTKKQNTGETENIDERDSSQ